MKRVIFDCETTGADKATDRIIQLAIKIVDEKGKVVLNKTKIYNPGIPISAAATKTHGITDDMVKDAPKFKEDAGKLKKIFEDSVLIGYNILVFDIPILMAEFDRAGLELDLSGEVIDVMRLETQLQPRTLSAVYERYTGKPLEGAHDAMADVDGTFAVLKHQYKKIQDEGLNKEELLAGAGIPANAADFFGKLVYDDEKFLVFKFGKHVNKRVLADSETRQYANWILKPEQNFPRQVKKLLQDELKKDVAANFKKKSEEKTTFKQVTQKEIHEDNSGYSFNGGKGHQAKLFIQQDAVETADDLPF